MKCREKISSSARQMVTYLKDYRFSRVLLKYFLLLFVCLALPVTVVNMWYGRQQRERMQQEIIKRNEDSLEQAYNDVNSVLLTCKNLAQSLSGNGNVSYLASQSSVIMDTSGNKDSLVDMLSVIKNANNYIDSAYIYFAVSEEMVTNAGTAAYQEFRDKEALENFSRDMPNRTLLTARIKNDHYPYLLTILYPFRISKGSNAGAVVINIDVEKLGDYIGSGQYRNTDQSPMLLIFNDTMETLVYSDEYRLFQEEEEVAVLKELGEWEGSFSRICELWGKSFLVSGMQAELDGLRYLYLTTTREIEEQTRLDGTRLRNVAVLSAVTCLALASILAVWVYRPIQKTVRLLSDMSMLTEWDRKEHVDEIEAIQYSILAAKKEKDNLNEQIQERIISLHNAQICALQTQINPHFLYNTLEAIANTAALLLNGDNKVTDMVCTLGQLMRTSLSNENYLVPLREELEHVRLYVKLVEFRYHGRVALHSEIPESMYEERTVKLTLQPLIENAIQHGLAHKRSGGNIWLRGEKKGKDNYIYVIDNGDGILEEDMEKLKEQLKESAITGSRHIGMRNVDQRLKLVFGEEYGLAIDPAEEGGLCVTVHFRTL